MRSIYLVFVARMEALWNWMRCLWSESANNRLATTTLNNISFLKMQPIRKKFGTKSQREPLCGKGGYGYSFKWNRAIGAAHKHNSEALRLSWHILGTNVFGGLQSANKLYRSTGHPMSAKLVANFTGRGVSDGQGNESRQLLMSVL
jgi:hypothetical protein